MKFKPVYKFILIYITLSSISCVKPPCECDVLPVQFIKVKILNQQGQNLIFGPSVLYNADSIQILEQKNNLNINNASVNKLTEDSALELYFYKPAAKSYIYYNQQSPSDSLEIKWIYKTGECCGEKYTFSEVDSVRFNNTYIKPANGILLLVK